MAMKVVPAALGLDEVRTEQTLYFSNCSNQLLPRLVIRHQSPVTWHVLIHARENAVDLLHQLLCSISDQGTASLRKAMLVLGELLRGLAFLLGQADRDLWLANLCRIHPLSSYLIQGHWRSGRLEAF